MGLKHAMIIYSIILPKFKVKNITLPLQFMTWEMTRMRRSSWRSDPTDR